MQQWDTIVIGSGSGGLTAAVALARAGQKVLVLEQHYLPGGWCHSFALEGHLFSPGVHYISDCGEGGGFRRLYEGLGLSGDIEFTEMNPDGFDHIVVNGTQVDFCRDAKKFTDRLIAKFPHERVGITQFMGTLQKLSSDIARCEQLIQFPQVLQLPFKAPTLCRWGFRTLKPLLDSLIKDPLLKDVLAAQCGNNGLAPSRVSLPMHAGMTMSYINGGAYYPRGGARSIPKALIRALKRHGGDIRVRTRVKQIFLKGERVGGVVLENGEIIAAHHVVSNADPAVTFGKLLPAEFGARERRKAEKTEYSVGLMSLFAATDMDLRAMGYDSGNWWWFRHGGVDRFYERVEREVPMSSVDGLFLSIPSIKDPKPDRTHHTLELFTFAPYSAFQRWADSKTGERSSDYKTFKERIGDLMLEAADQIIPGLSKRITFRAVGTPLTNDFYCETFRGAPYGTAKTPWQIGPFSFSINTSIDGLKLCGASTLSHGVAGAAVSGMMAAKEILGARTIDELLAPADGSLRVYPAERPEQWMGLATAEVA